MWLITKDGRAFNLDLYIRIEVSGGTLTAYHAGQGPGTGSTSLANDLSDLDINRIYGHLLRGEGVDLREQRSAYEQDV